MEKESFFRKITGFFSLRKIQVDIVSVFVLLISSFALVVILFSYSKNSAEILRLAHVTMRKSSEDLLSKVRGVTRIPDILIRTTEPLVANAKTVSYEDQPLVNHVLSILKYSDEISAIRIGSVEGNLIGAANLSLSPETTHMYNAPAKPLPKGAVYALRSVERSEQTPTETWYYLGRDLEVLDSENIAPTDYDPRQELWYAETVTEDKFHWSNTYLNLLGESGITAAAPALDVEGKMRGVVAMNLSENVLTDFFLHEHVGASGSSFILDQEGSVVIPPIRKIIYSSEGKLLNFIPEVFKEHLRSKETNFIFENNGVKYLVFISEFPLPLTPSWNILFIVPLDAFFHAIIAAQKEIILISVLIAIIFGILVYFSSKHIGTPVVKLAQEVRKIQHFDFNAGPPLKSHIIEIIELETSLNSMRSALRSFERYVPKEIVKVLIAQGQEISVGGVKKNVTVMFSDISDFTTFSEMLPVEKLLEFLTEYFEAFSKTIQEADGTIDKYIGDSVMAIWNAPQQVDDHPDKACLSALRCLTYSRKQQAKEGRPGWKTRFGLHTGEVVVGNIGTKERMNYTVIGDVVNTTARLHGVNKIYNTSIIISETLQQKIGTQFLIRPLDTVSVKGKKNKITVYELVGLLKGDPELLATDKQIELCHAFSIAYNRFYEGEMEEAKEHFLSILKSFPEDKPTQIYLERIAEMNLRH